MLAILPHWRWKQIIRSILPWIPCSHQLPFSFSLWDPWPMTHPPVCLQQPTAWHGATLERVSQAMTQIFFDRNVEILYLLYTFLQHWKTLRMFVIQPPETILKPHKKKNIPPFIFIHFWRGSKSHQGALKSRMRLQSRRLPTPALDQRATEILSDVSIF